MWRAVQLVVLKEPPVRRQLGQVGAEAGPNTTPAKCRYIPNVIAEKETIKGGLRVLVTALGSWGKPVPGGPDRRGSGNN
jgi:hypothetical protein